MAFDYRRVPNLAQQQSSQQQQQQQQQDYNYDQMSEPIPTPPPLPPQRVTDVAKSVLDRLRYGPRKYQTLQPAEAHQSSNSEQLLFSQKFGPATSQSTSHKTGLKIRALDINQAKTHVVLAGGKLLKTVRVDVSPPSCSEDFNLRAAAVNYAWDNNTENEATSQKRAVRDSQEIINVQRETFDIEDVAWSNGVFSDYIATAASNGKIMLYNLKRPGVEVARLHEHYRQVHKVDFNPIEGAFLLSGSQDGTVRLWDLRILKKDVMASSSSDTFPGRNDGVRHVKWSPRNTFVFAFGTDNGTVQRWDTRYNKGPKTKISAHFETCNSIDWHPDGKHLVSAGKDKTVKVWNLASDSRRQKAVFNLRTPKEIQNVRWRPSCIVTDQQEQTAKLCTHLATSYRDYPVVHVWDLRRPYMPFREIYHRVNHGTTDMLWRSKDLLWLVGPDGEFSQNDISFAPKTISRRSLSNVACDSHGDIVFCSKPRLNRHMETNISLPSDDKQNEAVEFPRNSFGLPLGASPGDDSLDEHFLSSSLHMRRHSRTPSTRSAKSLGTTPPTAEDVARMTTLDLEVGINLSEAIRPHQASRSGSIPGTFPSPIFTYLAMKFKLPPHIPNSSLDFFTRAETLFEQNAVYSQRASYYRDAQTWRILGKQICQEIYKSAGESRRKRLNEHSRSNAMKTPVKNQISRRLYDSKVSNGSKRLESMSAQHPSHHLHPMRESSSNVPTPVVRPVGDSDHALDENHHPLDLAKDVHRSSLNAELEPTSMNMKDSRDAPGQTPATENTDIPRWKPIPTQSEQQRALALMNEYRAQPRTLLNFEQPILESKHINVPPRLDRHHSSESLTFFPGSDGSRQKLSQTGSFLSEMSDSERNSSLTRDFDLRANSVDYPDKAVSPIARSGSDSGTHHSISRSPPSPYENRLASSSPGREMPHEQPGGGTLKFSAESSEKSGFSSRTESPERGRGNHILRSDNSPPISASVATQSPTATSSANVNELSSDSRNFFSPRQNESGFTSISTDHSNDTKPYFSGSRRPTPNATIGGDSADKTGLSDDHDSQAFNISDFLSPSPDVEDDQHIPLSARSMVRQLLRWYTEHSNAQMASHLLLLSISLLAPPGSIKAQEDFMTRDMLLSHDYLTNVISFSPEAATDVLKSYHLPLQSMGLSPFFAESILSTYHEQLMALNLLQPAVIIRRLSYPAFPAVYEQSIKEVEIRTLCLSCHNAINNPTNKMRCETCLARQAECTICWSRDSPFELPRKKRKQKKGRYAWGNRRANAKTSNIDDSQEPIHNLIKILPTIKSNDNDTEEVHTEPITQTSRLWTACLLCNHANHAACVYAWFSEHRDTSQGACPVEGCLCDCTVGAYRTERLARAEAQERMRTSDSFSKKNATLSSSFPPSSGYNTPNPGLGGGTGAGADLVEFPRRGSGSALENTSSSQNVVQPESPITEDATSAGLAMGIGIRRGDDWTVGESRAVKELRSGSASASPSGNGANTSGFLPSVSSTGRKKGRSTSATLTAVTDASRTGDFPTRSRPMGILGTGGPDGSGNRAEDGRRVRVVAPSANGPDDAGGPA